MYEHDWQNGDRDREKDKDRARTRDPRASRMDPPGITPGSISLTSFMRRPEHPIPSGLTDYKPIPDRAGAAHERDTDRARSGGRDVTFVMLPPNLAPGTVSVTQFMRRPEHPIPSGYASDEARAAYAQRRGREPESPRDREIRAALDHGLARVSAPLPSSPGAADGAVAQGAPREPKASTRLPSSLQSRMERAYARQFHGVELHRDSAEVPAGEQAFTRGHQIHLARGVDPMSPRGELILSHELAHVAQQDGRGERAGSRQEIEREAASAATQALRGEPARIALRADAGETYAFSEGHEADAHTHEHKATAGAHEPAHAPSATPASYVPASRSSSGTSTPAQRTATFDRPAATQRPSESAAPAVTSARGGAGGDGLLLPQPPAGLSPAAVGRLQNIRAANQGVAGAITNLPTADHQTNIARGAVVEPQAEQDAHAQHDVVATVDDRPPPSPEIEAACARIRQVIRDKRPPSEDKLVDAKPREMAQEAGDQMSAGVEQRAGTVRQGYADMQQNPQGTPSRTPVPATVPPAGVATPPVNAAAGAPDPLPHDDVSLDGDVAAQKQHVDDAGMNTEPAKLVKDGPIADAHGGVDDLQHMAHTDPAKVLANQAAAVAHAQGDMRALQAAADKALADARAGTVGHIATHTTGVKGSEEQQRAQAGAQMQAIFTRTQTSVDTLLQPLSTNAVARWQAGVDQLSTAFETALADVKRRIEERHHGHHGALGHLANAWDQTTDNVFGLPDWVTDDYDKAEAAFADGATSLITDISRDVNKVIADCKGLIQQARKDIEAIVHSLPASLQTWAQGEAAKLGQKLDQLSQHVDQTQQNLNKDLVNRADGAVQQVREQVADLREQAKGLVGKIAHAIGEFLKNPAKAIVDGLLRVVGIPPDEFWSLVNRLGDVIGVIAKDPVKFGKTLISGAGQGFKQFFEHFPTHLKEILMGWLFGQLGTAGVPMPSDFSGASIMVTVLAIAGIDTPMVTAMLGGEISDPAEAAEAHKELAGVLSGDPKALVALLREEFDPASLLPMIKDAAISFLIQTVITKAAERIAALLVPGGAILTAVEAIFKVLQWVINNAARIFTLIQSLVGAAAQAVAGNIAGVATAVEASLVQIIVVVIDFLTGYLGLGGLGGKLKGVIMKLSGKLKAALKKVLGAVAKRAKARAKTKHHHGEHAPDTHHKHDEDNRDPQKAKDDAKDPRNHQHDPDDKDPRNHRKDDNQRDAKKHKDDDEHAPKKHKDDDERDAKKHKDDADGVDDGPVGERITFHVGNETHTQYIDIVGGEPVPMVASTPTPVKERLEDWRIKLREFSREERQRAGKFIGEAIRLEPQVDAAARVAAHTTNKADRGKKKGILRGLQRKLANALEGLFEIFEANDSNTAGVKPWVPKNKNGNPYPEDLPGNEMVRGRPRSSWYEDQVQDHYDAEKPAPILLGTPTTFTGKSKPQNEVIPDFRTDNYDHYGDAKHKDPNFHRFIDDAVGTLERMWSAANVDGAHHPQALTSTLDLVTSQVVPREVSNEIIRSFAIWLRGRRLTAPEIGDVLARVRFSHVRPKAP